MSSVPAHTIVRYRPAPIGFYEGWRPVEVHRWRLFLNATHEEVTGDTCRAAPWVNHWSCETLSENGWRINGRAEWPSVEEAVAATSARTFATFAEALAAARKDAREEYDYHVRRAREVAWSLYQIDDAKPPVIP